MENDDPGTTPVAASEPKFSRSLISRRTLPRIVLAYLMILAAVLGASIAFWTTRVEQEVSELRRQLAHGQMIEMSLRQKIAGELVLRLDLEKQKRTHEAGARNFEEESSNARKREDTAKAGRSDSLADSVAQQENMVARAIDSFTYPLTDIAISDKAIDEQVTTTLYERGFVSGDEHKSERETRAAMGAERHDREPPPLAASSVSYDPTVRKAILPLWRGLVREIEQRQDSVPWLAFGVVLCVLGLVCFTKADLDAEVPLRSNRFMVSGLLATASGIALTLYMDETLWRAISLVFGLWAIFGIVFWKYARLATTSNGETPHPSEVEPLGYLFSHQFLRLAEGRQGRGIILLMAATVFLSSLVGFLFAQAQGKVEHYSHRAFESQIAFSKRDSERRLLVLEAGLAAAFELVRLRLECAVATQRAVLGSPSAKVSAPVQCDILEKEPYKSIAQGLDNKPFAFDSADGPAWKIINLLNQEMPNPPQFYALADGYVGLSKELESNSRFYLLSLTLLAIALYLFGQSLAMGAGLASKIIAAGGVFFLASASGFAIWAMTISTITSTTAWPFQFSGAHGRFGTAPNPTRIFPGSKDTTDSCTNYVDQHEVQRARQSPEEGAIELAAFLYGQAKPLFDAAEYAEARKIFDCVLAVRDHFATAQAERAISYSNTGDLDKDGKYRNLSPPGVLPKIVNSELLSKDAFEKGGWRPTARLLNNLGYEEFQLALTAGEPRLLEEAIRTLQKSIELAGIPVVHGKVVLDQAAESGVDPVNLRILLLNLGNAQLASGRGEDAKSAYRIVLNNLGLEKDEKLVASTITDLNIIETFCPKLDKAEASKRCEKVTSDIKHVKYLLLGRLGAAPEPGRASITNVRPWLRPSSAGWSANIENFDPQKDKLSVVWSAWVPEWNVWRVVQPLFEPAVDKDKLKSGGRVLITQRYDNDPSFCLPPGQYRVEFYLNGELVPEETKEMVAPAFSDYRSRELNVAMCRPNNWKLRVFENEEGRHLVRAFVTPEDKGVAYLFTFFAPKGARQEEVKTTALKQAWMFIKRWTEKKPTDEQFDAAIKRFQGCDSTIPPATLLHKEWLEPNGMAHVALVNGSFTTRDEACQMLESVGNYYDRNKTEEPGGN
jgi:hypothetical protein